MALSTSETAFFPTFIFFFLLFPPSASPLSFNLSQFGKATDNIDYLKDAFTSNGVIQLTKNQLDQPINQSVGRAVYRDPLHLWDSASGKLTDFETHFSFIMKSVDESNYGDGLAFFLVSNGSYIPEASAGGFIGLFNQSSALNSSANQVVAVEFDSFKNRWDPSPDHVGIDVNSVQSRVNVTWKSSIKNGSLANAWISYNATTRNLSVFLSYAQNPVFRGNSSLFYIIDLRDFLPEWVYVGFSASTGRFVEIHNVLSWEFSSTLQDDTEGQKVKKKKNTGLAVVLLSVVAGVICCGLVLAGFILWRRKRSGTGGEEDGDLDLAMNDEFERGTGPRKFTYKELASATNDFSEEGKLGEGGFGGVYKGYLKESNMAVAVKRVSRGSKQGKKEYVSEVKIISRLRHRNLVQLVGWCHERGELLLVYEFLPNGSLDSYLFGGKGLLPWDVRHRIALGLASSLLYLHEEWEQCVVHRDIKSSNIMLDSSFNAKLGDFGLARLVDHDQVGSETTVLAGTKGYLAPECATTGKASKESDVYSFGVVALEIACGRRPVELRAEPEKVRLVDWVWNLYGRGRILEAGDERLGEDLNVEQMECLMVVGLWCTHPDYTFRPSIRQVINVLSLQAPLPNLPSQHPVPVYLTPLMNMPQFLYTSSSNGAVSTLPTSSGTVSPSNSTTTTEYSSKVTVTSSSSSSTHLLKSPQIRRSMALSRRPLFIILSWFLLILKVSSAPSRTIFNFTEFAPNTPDIIFSGDAFASGEKTVQLTRNQLDKDLLQSSGRIAYASPVQIWDPATHHVADFTTHFRFEIDGLDKEKFGDGLAFFMAPVGSDLPLNSTGQWLGLFNSTTNGSASTQLVAVEFDTFQNAWDPSPNHIGIDINSIVSVTTKNWDTQIRNGSTGSAWVGYNSTTGSFFVFLTYVYDEGFWSEPSISYEVNLTEVLPDRVVSYGSKWVVWLGVAMGILAAGIGFGWIVFKNRGMRRNCRDNEDAFDASMEDKFAKGTGPRRFSYKELVLATNNFSEEGKLGQGGFGGVYRGTLNNSGVLETLAVKKISRGSRQGKKEYVTEVTVISRLRHRNLVRLIGWCHDYGEFLLVYEYMPHGSLDSYLFGKKQPPLKWKTRYRVALGLASALLYLHEEGEQCVVHRDIKSSNVMLDSNFNAKLGDFGLARFVDHELGSQTTVLAGTMGYLAPECLTTGRASKESDVYSFGVVALEIACGRKPVDGAAEEEDRVRLVEWVWGLYGEGKVMEAADARASPGEGGTFEAGEMKRLMTVGLWCVHPDDKARPSIRQVVQVLNGEAEVPRLPARMPVAVYCAPPLSISQFDYTSGVSMSGVPESPGTDGGNTSSTASSRASSTKSLLEKPEA
ncbi:hypothetical protein H6P81_020277 [Aristolochia fimbriata]|uniref:non-specific serine/threonine protein kinase n=1 Tax=Aristolochia fimbriata TaxID=158543 RepID=A0AAV7DY47_ARIFI|nr:hypothetical protein H6P81_020277 [Aristolochia fimbriata]